MIQRFVLTLLLFILSISAGGCKTRTVSHKLIAENAGEEISAKVGDLIQVTLEANPTTGYQWEWVSDEAPLLVLVGEPEYQSEADQNLVGAGGRTTFTFTVKATGDGTIHLIYHRSFEEGVAPIEEFMVKVTVE